MKTKRIVLSAATLLLAQLGTSSLEAQYPDFNGDGFDDLVVGVPFEDVGTGQEGINAGLIQVLYGAAGGVSVEGDQVWHQSSVGIADAVGSGEDFGSALALGDFDGDGFDDLAIGAPLEIIGSCCARFSAGIVHVLHGSSTGLTATGSQIFSQDTPGILDEAESSDFFGNSLAAADFDDNGFDDLAVGAAGERFEEVSGSRKRDAGVVHVIYGSHLGLVAAGDQLWHQDDPQVPDVADDGDFFGSSLATADFDGNGVSDLAIGAAGEQIASVENAGAVNVLYGVAGTGLTAAGSQFWHQDSPGILERADAFDGFGSHVTGADFDGDGFGDLAAGVQGESLTVPPGNTTRRQAGAVNVLYGSASGLTQTGNQLWSQILLQGTPEEGDRFGRDVSAGDFDGDGFADLAVGIDFEGIGRFEGAGAVNVIYGTGGGLSAADNQFLHQETPGVLETAGSFDGFGGALLTVNP